MEESDFDYSLRLSINALLFCGVTITKNKLRNGIKLLIDKYLFYITVSWLYIDVIGQFNWSVEGILNGKSFIETSVTAPLITICLLGTVKTACLFMNKDILIKVVDKLRNLHPDKDDDEKTYEIDDISSKYSIEEVNAIEIKEAKIKIIENSKKLFYLVSNLLYYIAVVMVCCFISMPLFSMTYEYITTGTTDLKYPYFVQYFININKITRWPFVYLHQMISTFIVGANIIGPDIMFYAMCIYIQMHFRLLGHRLENMAFDSPETNNIEIMQAVKRHQELILLVDQVELLYSKSMLFNIITSSFLICLSLFIATMLDDLVWVVKFVMFLFTSLSQIFLLCFFGDMLMRSSTDISLAVYNSRWFNADVRTKKSLLLILMRAQKPCKLTAYKFANINLIAYTTSLRRSWSYFALLKTIYK